MHVRTSRYTTPAYASCVAGPCAQIIPSQAVHIRSHLFTRLASGPGTESINIIQMTHQYARLIKLAQ